ncbi:MAG TPA: thiamine pyrophosphate-binding protein [Vicinamibacterales bacterium]
MAAVADLVVRRLADAGVRTLFGVPGGGSSLDLIEAAGRAGLPFVLTSTETAAAVAALAQAEITRTPGACLTALGPGAASVVNGVAAAFLDRAPVIVFTDSHPTSGLGRFEHQRLALRALFEPLTKGFSRLDDAEAAGDAVSQALNISMNGRPGPVHVEWPADVTTIPEATDGFSVVTVEERIDSEPGFTNTDAGSLESLLARSQKPLLIVGLGARTVADASAIRSFCERRDVPAMVTYKAKGVVPDDHPLFAGVFTNAAIEQALVREADLVIGLGLDPVELLPKPWTVSAPIAYWGPWPVSSGHVPFVFQRLLGVAAAVAEIDSRLPGSKWARAQVARVAAEQRRLVRVPADRMTAQRVVDLAASRLAGGSRVTVDAGAHMFPATMLWPVSEPNGMLISNGLSTMGFALPAAIGAALIDTDRPVVALTGDGGLLMCVGELLTAARERLRIIVIVFNDSSLSLIEIKQQARRLPAAGVALAPVDWPALAGSLGVQAFSARDEPELERALEQAQGCAGPSLIDARIDRSNYGETARAIRGRI